MVITLFSFCVLMAGIVMCSPLRGAPQALNAVKIRAVHMEFIFEGNDDVPSQDYLIPLFASNPKLKNPDEDFATRLIPFEASQLDPPLFQASGFSVNFNNTLDEQGFVIPNYLDVAEEPFHAILLSPRLEDIACEVTSKGFFGEMSGVLVTDASASRAQFRGGAMVNIDQIICRYRSLEGELLSGLLINPPPELPVGK